MKTKSFLIGIGAMLFAGAFFLLMSAIFMWLFNFVARVFDWPQLSYAQAIVIVLLINAGRLLWAADDRG